MSATRTDGAHEIASNIAIHDQIAEKYDGRHGEIFNSHEQARLRASLAAAKELIETSNDPLRAFDFGCGSGNLTRHMLDLGMAVTAADVSQRFLDLVRLRFNSPHLETLKLNGSDISGAVDASFDFAASYSVLHHVPDYLAAVREMARIVRPGGVIYIDHEQAPSYWAGDPVLERYYREGRPYDWRKWLVPSNYFHKAIRLINPRHANEGDIHVWPDDHIEWDLVDATLDEADFTIVARSDYLLFQGGDRPAVHSSYTNRCNDMRCTVYRRSAA